MTIWNDDLGRLIGLGSNVESAKEIFALGSAEISFLWGPRDCSSVFSQGLIIFGTLQVLTLVIVQWTTIAVLQ